MPEPMTDLDLARLKALADSATPGPRRSVFPRIRAGNAGGLDKRVETVNGVTGSNPAPRWFGHQFRERDFTFA